MSSSQTLQEIAECFGNVVSSNEKLMAECANMCELFNMTPENLYYKWEALSFNSTRSTNIFTMDSAVELKASIRRDIAAENNRKMKPRARLAGTAMRGRVPVPQMKQSKAVPSSFGGDGARLTVKVEEGDIMLGRSTLTYKGPKSDVASKKNRAYRYMYEKITERSGVLNERITEFVALIQELYGVEPGDPSAITEEEITVVGRIALDAESSSSSAVKLNEASLTLESARTTGYGRRIPIRFDPQVKIRGGAKGAGGLGFFPGAIVALRGKNGSGSNGYFLASEILALPPMKPSPASLGPTGVDDPFSMCIISGPYTPDADLNYSPWHAFVATLKSMKPDVLLMTGPFVDSMHPKFRSGHLEQSPNQLYKQHFIDVFREFLAVSPNSVVLLVPSIRDVISDHPVYPQCELGLEFSGGEPRIHLLPNPCRFTLNHISFAVTSVDVISHLKKEEFIKRTDEVDALPDDSGADAMGGACRHMLQQRSFYPVFPVPFDLMKEVNLDVSHSEMLKMNYDAESNYAPDVLVVPSKLKDFAKTVQNTLFINPSFLYKGVFASLSLMPGDKPLKERLKVEMGRRDRSTH